jgi:hypothetical protein
VLDTLADKALPAILGAIVGSIATFLANWFLARRKLRGDARLHAALDLLGYLGKTINRESPERLVGHVSEFRGEWAGLVRTLYLLNVPEQPRRALDSLMTSYFDSLDEWASRPDRRPEVERRRELAREEAYRLMRRLGV